MKIIKALVIAVMILTSLWAGIGIGIASADSKPVAEVRIIGGNRIEIWKGGMVVIKTTQENVTSWGDYIIVKGEVKNDRQGNRKTDEGNDAAE